MDMAQCDTHMHGLQPPEPVSGMHPNESAGQQQEIALYERAQIHGMALRSTDADLALPEPSNNQRMDHGDMKELLFEASKHGAAQALRDQDRAKLLPNHRADITLPTITIKKGLVDVDPPPRGESGVKSFPKWEMAIDAGLKDEFVKFMETSATVQSASYRPYMNNIERLFHVLDIEGEHLDAVSICCALNRQEIIQNLMGSKLYAATQSWTNQMLKALTVFCDMCFQKAALNEWQKEQADITNLKLFAIKPNKMVHQKVKNANAAFRHDKDAETLEDWPSTEVRGDALFRMMCVLYWVVEQAKELNSPTHRALANACIVGIIFLNGYAGRSLEWTLMKAAQAMAQLQRHPWILCQKHKTVRTYGSLAKYIAPGTHRALLKYLEMPDRKTDKLLEPCNSESTFPISTYLRRASEIFFDEMKVPFAVNKIRKWVHSYLQDIKHNDRIQAALQDMDAHSKEMARGKNYNVKTARKDAQFGKVLWELFTDELVVGWPDEQELARNYDGALGVISVKKFNKEELNFDDDEVANNEEYLITSDFVVPDWTPPLAIQDRESDASSSDDSLGDRNVEGALVAVSPQPLQDISLEEKHKLTIESSEEQLVEGNDVAGGFGDVVAPEPMVPHTKKRQLPSPQEFAAKFARDLRAHSTRASSSDAMPVPASSAPNVPADGGSGDVEEEKPVDLKQWKASNNQRVFSSLDDPEVKAWVIREHETALKDAQENPGRYKATNKEGIMPGAWFAEVLKPKGIQEKHFFDYEEKLAERARGFIRTFTKKENSTKLGGIPG